MLKSLTSRTIGKSSGLDDRSCAECGVDIAHKKSNAQYCNRKCKNRASERRAIADGRRHRQDRARYSRERDHRVAYAKTQYWADPEKSREYSRQYRKSHPEVRGAQAQARRARKSGVESRSVTHRETDAIFNRQRGCCYYCGERAKLAIDHVIPLSKAGRHAIGNLVGACQPCNSSKAAMLLIEWRLYQKRKGVSLTL